MTQPHWLVTGATGFIGSHFCQRLLDRGHRITALTRTPDQQTEERIEWISTLSKFPMDVSYILNLCGEPIAEKRWTETQRQKIWNSRVEITKELSHYINQMPQPPELIITGSAVGYYGYYDGKEFGEGSMLNESCPQGDGYAAELCAAWEDAMTGAARRKVIVRTGLVLGPGGLLDKLRPIFRMGIGGPMGSGRQGMSWIHLEDMLRLLMYVVDSPKLNGPVNAVAPNPVSNAVFSKTLADSLHRPAFLKTPAVALKVLFGQMAEELLLNGQFVYPDAAMSHNFIFDFPTIEKAMQHLTEID